MQDFEKKAVVVTGAAAGIGREIACAFARQGAYLFLLDKDPQGLAGTARQIKDAGGIVDTFVCDLANPGEVVSAFSVLQGVDCLINNAGVGISKSLFDLTIEEWDYVMDVNLRGTFLCCREAAAKMPPGGSIVNISSTRALMSETNTEAYSASKGGIAALTHALASSLAPRRIRVNTISPGWIETGDYGSLRQKDHSQHPAGRVGTPADIARACLFLCGDENDFVTGADLIIDGGMTHKMIYLED